MTAIGFVLFLIGEFMLRLLTEKVRNVGVFVGTTGLALVFAGIVVWLWRAMP